MTVFSSAAPMCVFEYRYRDAANYKTHGVVWLADDLPDADAMLRACFEDGFLFIAEQLGIPSLHGAHFAACGSGAGALDHDWHEFERLHAAAGPMPADAVCAGSVVALVKRAHEMRRRWNVAAMPRH